MKQQHLQRKKLTIILPNGRSLFIKGVSKKLFFKLLTDLKYKPA
jgi:hypothetical protein